MRPSRLSAIVAVLWLTAAACSGSGGTATPTTARATPGPAADAPAAAAATTVPAPPERSYAGVDPAPAFPAGLDWLNTGRPLSLEELRGKVVVLDFWTYGCINCIHIIPDLERLEREFADELVVIGVHSAKFSQEGSTDNIRQVILRYGLEHPVVNDREFEVWNSWGARAWPTTVVIDPAGNVVGGHEGEGVYPVLQPVISSLVAEFDATGQIDRRDLGLELERDGLPRTILSFPGKVHADPAGDRIFIADSNHNRIVVARISDGEVLEVFGSGRAGFADGAGLAAEFDAPQGMALAGDLLYVADQGNHAIRTIDLTSGAVATVAGTGFQGRYPPAGGTGPTTSLHSPWDVTIDGDTLYVAMAGSHQIWTLDLASGETAPYAGNGRESTRNGPRAEAELAQPSGVTLDDAGILYFADSESSSIRFAEPGPDGEVGLLAGSGEHLFDFGDIDAPGDQARLQHPLGVSYLDGVLYVADTYNSKIKMIDPASGAVETRFGGTAGWRDGAEPLFYEPGGLHAVEGRLFVADTNNHAVRIVDLATGEASTLLLKGIERFAPPPDDADYAGTVVALPQARVGPGAATVVIDLALPEGYKVNEDAPSSMSWEARGGVASFGDDANRSLTGVSFPQEVSVEFSTGAGQITGDLTVIWCADDAESLCFIEQLRLTAPVTVVSGGAGRIVFEHAIQLPA